MNLGPLTYTIGYSRILTDVREQATELQRQLGTGQRTETYGGLGSDRYTSLSVNERLSEVSNYTSTIDLVNIRLDVADLSLNRIAEIVGETRSEALPGVFKLQGNGQTIEQTSALLRFDETVALLNARADGRYIFGGHAIDEAPVEPSDVILNGSVGRDGLKTLISERQAADLGPLEQGRLTTTATATDLTLSEDGAHPFGLKLSGFSTSIPGATATGPAGAPQTGNLAFGVTQPDDGDTLAVSFVLPDGTETELILSATSGTPGPDEFEIGATIADTITNLDGALEAGLQNLAATELSAASALTASTSFFDGTEASPPLRVDGPPFDTATALIAGTTDNTVVWYKGANVSGNPRTSASAAIDDGQRVNYGLEANEEAFRQTLQNIGAFAAETFDETVATDPDRYQALRERVGRGLNFPPGVQKVDDVRIQIGVSRATIGKALERHLDDSAMLEELKSRIEGIDTTEVAAELLSLRTRLEASYSASGIISRLSLANFL